MFQGRVVHVTPVAGATQQELIKYMTGFTETREDSVN
jgi:hypothetical protein